MTTTTFLEIAGKEDVEEVREELPDFIDLQVNDVKEGNEEYQEIVLKHKIEEYDFPDEEIAILFAKN